ncbi:HDOD domain-containing protein [Dechloromonas sp. ZY10]|uniref:HDOD domain-containing protein n=1 Tax=Dechloromonas aquae TaxID=2664436 RepID=UPI0035297ADC
MNPPLPASSQNFTDKLLVWLLPPLLFLLGSLISYALLGKLAEAGLLPHLARNSRLMIGAGGGCLLALLAFWLLRPTPAQPPSAGAELVPSVLPAIPQAALPQSPPLTPPRPTVAPLPPPAARVTPERSRPAPPPARPAAREHLPAISLPPEFDKKGSALAQQRFQMLEDIAKELEGDVVFPTCFDLIVRLREVLQKPDFTLNHVSNVISLDPLVSSKVLRQANSAIYGGSKVLDLRGAVTRLGVNAVRSIVMGIAMQQFMLSRHLVSFGEVTRHLWEHSVRSACAARVIARRLTAISPEDAQLAGLVHDLGAFYMIYRAAQYEELRIRPDTVKYLVFEWHESIGQTLLAALGMPEHIVTAVGDHDQPRPLPPRPLSLADVVHAANHIAGGGQAGMLDKNPDWNAADLDEAYAELLPEIEAATQEMLQTL